MKSKIRGDIRSEVTEKPSGDERRQCWDLVCFSHLKQVQASRTAWMLPGNWGLFSSFKKVMGNCDEQEIRSDVSDMIGGINSTFQKHNLRGRYIF